MSIRVIQLASELGLKPPELLKKLQAIDINIRSVGMTLDDAQEKKARAELGNKDKDEEKKSSGTAKTAKKSDGKKNAKLSKEEEAKTEFENESGSLELLF